VYTAKIKEIQIALSTMFRSTYNPFRRGVGGEYADNATTQLNKLKKVSKERQRSRILEK